MSTLEAILYGFIQGVTEYLPISSSAHLILLPKVLGDQDPGLAFNVLLHLGTLFSTLVYFWKDWCGVFSTLPFLPAKLRGNLSGMSQRESLSGPAPVSWKALVIATVPALIAGALLHSWVRGVLRGNIVIVTTLIVGGILLYLIDRYAKRDRKLESMQLNDAFYMGLAQCLALIPGVSRSGATITCGRALGLDRDASARFSFLMSAPVIAAAVVFELRNWGELLNGPLGLWPLLVAFFSSFVFGWLSIGFLLAVLRKVTYAGFAAYRILIAVVVIFVFGT